MVSIRTKRVVTMLSEWYASCRNCVSKEQIGNNMTAFVLKGQSKRLIILGW